MDNESYEELHQEYIREVIGEDTKFNEFVLTTARTIVHHHNNFLVKEPCKDSLILGWISLWKYLMEIIGDAKRYFEWKNMYFVNYLID